jgi:hypothetical protein
MTVNERFYASDLFELWEAAIQRKDRAAMIALLGRVELGDQAEDIAETVLQRRT